MKFDIISFDLQGTLSDSAFSDEFWLEILPKLYSKSKGIRLDEAKGELKERFKTYEKYDYRYYSFNYWMNELRLGLSFDEALSMISHKPHFFDDIRRLLEEIKGKARLIIISSTTKEFIEAELYGNRIYFDAVYSSIDDFGIAGKPKELYEEISKIYGVSPSRILHIGDCKEMDVKNAKMAGLEAFYLDKKLPRKEVIEKLREVIFKE
ncbi:MAG: HAD family hydrolase [Candidatus Woesearchaeota archaeon]